MERKYRIWLTEKASIQPLQIARLLPQLHCTAQVECSGQLNGELPESVPDMIIADCGEAEVAAGLTANGHGAFLFLGTPEEVEAILPSCVSNGFLCMERENLHLALPQLFALSNRLYFLRVRESSLQRKLGDTKLVNRAKLLLITRLQMSEAEAHRYIEKTAMDNGESRRDVALRLIRTYEE